ncbi:MAG: alcohol dehydrogenase catalytic domain-containing protein [Christensenellaceae bacterium]
MSKMKANVFYEPLKMKLEEIEIPEIAANEVLIKVKAVGICGSDISYYYGHSPLGTPDGKGPLVLGHEFSGVVEKLGEIPAKMGMLKVGDRVCVNPVAPCNACVPCLNGEYNECENLAVYGVDQNGAFAEYTKAMYSNVYKIPDTVSFEEAAVAEPLACSTYSVKKLDVKLGQTAVIFGCGPIGLMDVQLVKASGAGKVFVVDIADYNLEKALELGATQAFNTLDKNSKYYTADLVASVKAANNGRLAQRAVVPTNAMVALQQALQVTGPSSTVVFFGLPSPDDVLKIGALDAIQADRTIKFSWLAPLVWDNVFNVIASGQVKLGSLITHRFTLDQVEQGIKFMKESKDNKVKGVILVD